MCMLLCLYPPHVIRKKIFKNSHLCPRICAHCWQRTSARERCLARRNAQPLLALLYSKLMQDRRGMEALLPRYDAMAHALWAGE